MAIKRTPGDRVTPRDEQEILSVYRETRSIAKTAQITGWTATTVSKYVKTKSIWDPCSKDFPGYVVQKNQDGEMVNIFKTAKEAAEVTGVSESNISHCISGKTKTAGGFVWKRIYSALPKERK